MTNRQLLKAIEARAAVGLRYGSDTAASKDVCLADILSLVRSGLVHKPRRTHGDDWADYSIPDSLKLRHKSPTIYIGFRDGELVRWPCVSIAGKPLNIGRAMRGAAAAYRSRKSRGKYDPLMPVPEVAIVRCLETGQEWNVDRVNAETADHRRGVTLAEPGAMAA
jgi:hypothetical protein